jgi:hypothetical protein
VALYKHFGKELLQDKRYGSSTTEQRITTLYYLFYLVNGTATEVKKLKELPYALPDKEKELRAFIRKGAGSMRKTNALPMRLLLQFLAALIESHGMLKTNPQHYLRYLVPNALFGTQRTKEILTNNPITLHRREEPEPSRW